MKKRKLITSTALAVCCFLSAQQSQAQQSLIQLLKSVNYPLGKLEHAELPFNTHNSAARPTGTKQRLMATASLQIISGQYVRVNDSVRFFRPAHTPDNIIRPGEWPFNFNLYFYSQSTPPDPKEYIDIRDSSIQIAAVNGAYTKLEYKQKTTVLDEYGQVKETISQYMNPGTMTWENVFRHLYTYNSNHKMTLATVESWTNNTWQDGLKQEFEYDAAQRITSQTLSRWDNTTAGLKYDTKDTYTYDGAGDWTSMVKATWNGTWEDTTQYTYTYDASHKRTSELFETWDGVWTPETKTLYIYNNEGLRIADTMKNWNTPTSQWIDEERRTFTYDAGDHHVSTEVENSLDGIQWEKDAMYLFTYQGNDVSSMINQYWDGNWQNSSRYRLEFDGNNNPTSLTGETWNTAANTFQSSEGDFRFLLYYEDYEELSAKELSTNIDFNIFPNPSKDQVHIRSNEKKIHEVRLIDMQGKTVYQNQAALNSNTVTISTALLPEGNYILSIDAGKHKGSKVIVIRR